jgi:hypothetical protein
VLAIDTFPVVEEVFSKEPHMPLVPSAPNPLKNLLRPRLLEVMGLLIVLQPSVTTTSGGLAKAMHSKL